MALSLLITRDGRDWDVWISLPNHDPIKDVFGFAIGVGDTRDAAVADAVQALEEAVERLQAPPGQIEERQAR